MYKYKSLKVNGKCIDEHRKVMQDLLGRKLSVDEVIHHINGDKSDNRVENLQILSRSEHSRIHMIGRVVSDETRQKIRAKLINVKKKKKLPKEIIDFIKLHYIPRNPEYGARALARKFGVSKSTIIYNLK